MSGRNWVFIVLAVVLAIYVYSYYLHPSDISILHAIGTQFDPSSLLEKQPVVVSQATDPKDFIEYVRSTWTFTRHVQTVPVDTWIKNKFKYMVIQATSDCEVLVCPATAKRDPDGAPENDASIIAFKMTQGQVVIIPFHWSLYIPNSNPNTSDSQYPQPTVHVEGIHDFITFFLP